MRSGFHAGTHIVGCSRLYSRLIHHFCSSCDFPGHGVSTCDYGVVTVLLDKNESLGWCVSMLSYGHPRPYIMPNYATSGCHLIARQNSSLEVANCAG